MIEAHSDRERATAPELGRVDEAAGANGAPASAPCAVKLPSFEGPLDLLLHLIRANEVDVSDIPIALITEQYLEYLDLMRLLDIDVAAEYLVMAATLAHIKSRLLLPPEPDADAEGEGEDPRAELARRLAEYAVFKEAARALGARPLLGRDVFAGGPDADDEAPEPVLAVSTFALLEALRAVLARVPPEDRHHEVYRDRLTVQDRMLFIMDRLRVSSNAALRFEELLVEGGLSRHRVVVSFLALLELARIQAVRLFQSASAEGMPSGPIRVRLAVAPSDEAAEAPA